MRKIGLISLLLVVLILTACQGKTTTPTPTPSVAPTEAPIVGAKPGECLVASSLFPSPRPSSAAVYAPITADDHTKGPADATMTIIEYSDFT